MSPQNVAKYFLLRAQEDGELISPLKMQKLVYYAYAWYFAYTSKKLFYEQIEAWANGPVMPTLYQSLKVYGSAPIPAAYLGFNDEAGASRFVATIEGGQKNILDEVYDKYMTLTAFELVVLTHKERPWAEARKGLESTTNSDKPITDEDIALEYKVSD